MSARFHILNRVVCIGVLLLCASCSRKPEEPVLPADTLAVIGDRILTQRDLDAEMAHRAASGLVTLSPRDLLDRMLMHEALVLEARRNDFEKDPAVKRKLDRVLITQLRETELATRFAALSVSDEELKQIYASRIVQFTTPALNRVAMLYLKKDKNASPTKVNELRTRMQEAKDKAADVSSDVVGFGKWSVAYSDSTVGRYRGGDLGWIRGEKARFRFSFSPTKKPSLTFG